MNAIRIWSIVTIVAMVGILVAGWFLGIAPRLADARAANDERVMVEALNAGQQARLAELERLSNDQSKLERELDELRREMPDGAQVPELIGQLSVMNARTGTQLTGFTAAEPSEFVAVDAGAPTPAASGEAASGDAAASTIAPAPQGLGGGLYSIPVNVQVSGTEAQVTDFVRQVQQGDRLFLVTGLTITVEDQSAAIATASIDGLVYVMLGANAGVTAASSPAS